MAKLISIIDITEKKVICINMEVGTVPRIGELIRLMDIESEGTEVKDYRVVEIEWMVARVLEDLYQLAECRVKVQREKEINIAQDVLGGEGE